MSQDGVTKRGIGEPCDHCNLDGRHDLPCVDTEGSEAKDAITISLHQGLRLRSRTTDILTAKAFVSMPNSSPRRKYEATLAL